MRILLVATLPFVAAAAFLFAKNGCRLTAHPYGPCQVLPSAKDYWLEYPAQGPGIIRRGWWQSWPVDEPRDADDFVGEVGSLRVLRAPGLGRNFLILEHCVGNSTTRKVVWEISANGRLRRVSDTISSMELAYADNESHFFQDLTGDGIEELLAPVREWSPEEDNWTLRYEYHVWNGREFVPVPRPLPPNDDTNSD